MVAGAIINADYEWKPKDLQIFEENLKKERPNSRERERERVGARENRIKKACQRRKDKI